MYRCFYGAAVAFYSMALSYRAGPYRALQGSDQARYLREAVLGYCYRTVFRIVRRCLNEM